MTYRVSLGDISRNSNGKKNIQPSKRIKAKMTSQFLKQILEYQRPLIKKL